MRDHVFISYSHRDDSWLQRLQVYLKPLEHQGRIRRWDDTLIGPGQRWEAEIREALERTRVAVLLVSAEFLASDFISGVELPCLLGVAQSQGVRVIPVVLDHCNFQRHPELSKFQAIHNPSEPLYTLARPAQDAVLAQVASAVADVFDTLPGQTRSALSTVPARQVNLPERNRLFQGRAAALQALDTALRRSGRVALCGLPGLGKSETLIEFAHRRCLDYDWIFWCRADAEAQLIHGFCDMAAALALPEAGTADQLAAASAARAALASRGRWLLVLDAADDLDTVRPWLPAAGQGHVLLSTRSAAIGALVEPIELDTLQEDDGVAFLLRRSGLMPLDGPADPALLAAAREVVRATAGFPLALDQAGAYVEETGCSLEDYAAMWHQHSHLLLQERGQGSLRRDESLWQAWRLSLRELESRSAPAVALLRLLCFCHCEALPDATLEQAAAYVEPALAAALASPIGRNALMREALRFAFVRRDSRMRQLGMHRLVQHFLLADMPEALRKIAAAQALQWLDAVFPAPEFVRWRECDALMPHVLAALAQAAALSVEGAARAHLSVEAGYYLIQRARCAEARPLIDQALGLYRAMPTTPAVMSRALMIDGLWHMAAGRHEPARQRLGEAARQLEREPADLGKIRILDRLGIVELNSGHVDAAQSWLEQALLAVASAGVQHTAEAAQCVNDLGAVHVRRGELDAARKAFEQAASVRAAVLPPNHPSVSQSLNNLAVVCAQLGQHDEALASYEQALSLREAAVGLEHPLVAETLVNLGLLHRRRSDLAAARAAFERAASICQSCRGPLHPDSAKAQACLARVALDEGRVDEAQRLYTQARDTRLQLLGADHVDSARALAGLGRVARARGNAQAAMTALREALALLRRHLGDQHAEVLEAETELAQLASAASGPAEPGTAALHNQPTGQPQPMQGETR